MTKSQKEQLTERFQLKVTIGRREDWETAVKEADGALKLSNEGRLQEIEPKIEFYTKKIGSSRPFEENRKFRFAFSDAQRRIRPSSESVGQQS